MLSLNDFIDNNTAKFKAFIDALSERPDRPPDDVPPLLLLPSTLLMPPLELSNILHIYIYMLGV